MKLSEVSFSTLYFPKVEWMWLRPSKPYVASYDEIVWTWKHPQSKKLFAWSNEGIELFSSDPHAIVNTIELPENLTELEVYCSWIKRAFESERAEDSEWTAALKVLSDRFKHDMSRDGIPKALEAALIASGLEPHLSVLSQRAQHHFLAQDELEFLFQKHWTPDAFELFEAFPLTLREAMLKKLKTLPLSAPHAKEAILHAFTIAKKLSEKAALSLLNAEFKTVEEFRTSLYRTAQPELYAMAESRIQKLRALKAPPRTSIYGDPSFEQDDIKITHTPRNMGDIELFKNWVDSDEFMEKFKELLDIYRQ